MFSFSLQTISVWAFSHALEATSALQAQSHRAPPSPSHQTLKILSFRSRLRLRRSMNWSTNPRIDLRPRAFDPLIYEPTNQSFRLHRWPRAFAPRTHEPISLSLSLWFWSTHELIWVFVWFWFFTFSLWSLIFLLLLWWCGWWCFGGFLVVWWWVLCGWWWKIAFSECYQTHENIF